MKDAFEVLYQKEADLARLRQEIESLAIVAPLLADEIAPGDPNWDIVDDHDKKSAQKAIPRPAGSDATGTHGRSSSAPRAGFWQSLRR